MTRTRALWLAIAFAGAVPPHALHAQGGGAVLRRHAAAGPGAPLHAAGGHTLQQSTAGPVVSQEPNSRIEAAVITDMSSSNPSSFHITWSCAR